MPPIVIQHPSFSPAPVRTPIDVPDKLWRVNENEPWSIWFSRLNDTLGAIISGTPTLVSGTLSPDERPVGLGTGEANLVLFYSTDKDHLLRWTGAAWQVMNYDAGTICFKIVAPGSNGWVLCNGSGTAAMTLPDGSLSTVNVPDMIGSYPKGGNAYSGATPTPANAPGLSGAPTGTIGGSASITGSLVTPAHAHNISNLSGTTDSALGTYTPTGTLVISDLCINASADLGVGEVDVVSCGSISGALTGDPEDFSHDHTFSGISGSTDTDGGGVSIDTSGLGIDPSALTFTGNKGSLAVDATGQPEHTTLLPYLRL